MKDISVPLRLINILSDGEFHSGEYLGELMGMSRAGVNKHIQTIRDWGIDVFTVPGKGYSLPSPMQLLDEQEITKQLPEGGVTVLPWLTPLTSIYSIVYTNCALVMHVSLNISKRDVVAVAGTGFRLLVPIYTSLCSGV